MCPAASSSSPKLGVSTIVVSTISRIGGERRKSLRTKSGRSLSFNTQLAGDL